MNNKLIEIFGKEKRWINWSYQVKDGKKTKVPHGSSTDSNTWSLYKDLNKDKPFGIIFTPSQQLLGIDIDHCINKETREIEHEKQDAILALIDVANTYTEISPSGTGLHLFLKISEPLPLVANKKAPFELYTSGRFFTVTLKPYGIEKNVRIVNLAEAKSILSIIGYPWNKGKQNIEIPKTSIKITYDVLEKMFASKNGANIKALYEGDISKYKNDQSSADMALCSHLAFWTQRNFLEIERLWIASPLAKREKTQNRKDYRDRTINAAIENCKEVYTPPTSPEDIDFLYTWKGKEKIYTQNTENISRILAHHSEFKGNFRYDSFKNVFELKQNDTWRVLEENDAVVIQTRISILFNYFQKVGKDMVYDAIMKVCKENTIDSAADFIKSLTWDKKKRLDSWLTSVYGTPDDKYHKAVGTNWIKGLIKRIVEPGCKFDFVLVLEGEQGVKKSTSLGILGGDWHVETTMSTDNKDFFMQFAGKAIVEFSEGETLSRTEVKRMKAIITMQSDKYRPPYERVSKDFPRHCVFAMTTNQTEYLKDETGNRRWLPVTVVLPEANVEWLIENREQLFAEAYHRVFKLKETIYEFPKEETLAAQQARRIQDPNVDLITHWYFKDLKLEDRGKGITIYQVYRDAINGGHASKPMNKYDEMCISSVLKDNLKLTRERAMVDGLRTMRWFDSKIPKQESFSHEDVVSSVDKEFDAW